MLKKKEIKMEIIKETFTRKKNKIVFPDKVKHAYKESGDLIEIFTDFKIRNYKTILYKEPERETYCSKCRKKLRVKNVAFSSNGMGRMVHLPVQFCPTCDDIPPETSAMWILRNDCFAMLEI